MQSDDAQPADPNLLLQEANKFFVAGRLRDAAAIYQQLLQQYPPRKLVLNRLGEIALRLGKFDQGIALLNRSLAIAPHQPEVLARLAEAFCKTSHLDEALACYDRALSMQPDLAIAHYNRGVLLEELERFDEALASYDRAIVSSPHLARAHYNRGGLLARLKRFDEALASYGRAAAIRPGFAKAHYNRATLFTELKRFDEALASYDRAIAINPDFIVAHVNRGILLADTRRFDEAAASYEQAITRKPDYAEARLHKAELLLVRGDYPQGWDLFEWRWRTPFRRNNPLFAGYPLWSGEQSVAGKAVLLHPEAGFGDYIMFARYVPLLQARGATVVIYAPPPLVPLFAALDGQVRVVEQRQPLPHVDFQCPIMSLPRAFSTTVDTIPADTPYLRVPEAKREYWQEKLGRPDKPRIGLMWSGNQNRNIDRSPLRSRSVPFRLLRPLLDLPCEFHSLQKEIVEADAVALATLDQVNQHQGELHDFSDTAGLIAAMDLVISIDTSVAHLAGALGKPLWVTLPYTTDYRWAHAVETTPWYPAARLFRQSEIGDWAGVMQRVAGELIRFCASFGRH